MFQWKLKFFFQFNLGEIIYRRYRFEVKKMLSKIKQ